MSDRAWKTKDVAEFLQASESWVRHAVAEGREQETSERNRRRLVEESLAQLTTRRAALEELERDRVGLAPGAATLLAARARFDGGVLGPLSDPIRAVYAGQRATVPSCLPGGEGLVRWLRANMPEDAETILKRTRRLSSAHDLNPERRNPASPPITVQ